MAIFGHNKFIPVLLGEIVKKQLKQPFLAIPNLYQSFWETLSEKDWNKHFWPFLIYTSLFRKNCWKNLEQPFLAIPNLYQSSWEKLLEKNSEWPLLTNPNLYQSFWETLSEKDWNKHFWPFLVYTSLSGENCWKKFGTTIFGHSKFIPVLLGNIVRKRLEQTFLAIPNLYQSFWEKLLEKIWNNHFWPFQIYTSLFGKNCQKKFGMAIFWLCLIYTSLLGKNCQKKIGTTIFGHS